MKLYWIILIAGLIALGATEYLQNFTNDKAVINGNAKALGYQKLSSRGDTDSDPDDDSDDSDDSDEGPVAPSSHSIRESFDISLGW